jgi:hypothetical protein
MSNKCYGIILEFALLRAFQKSKNNAYVLGQKKISQNVYYHNLQHVRNTTNSSLNSTTFIDFT